LDFDALQKARENLKDRILQLCGGNLQIKEDKSELRADTHWNFLLKEVVGVSLYPL